VPGASASLEFFEEDRLQAIELELLVRREMIENRFHRISSGNPARPTASTVAPKFADEFIPARENPRPECRTRAPCR
jgi:hypothetical protein